MLAREVAWIGAHQSAEILLDGAVTALDLDYELSQ